MTPATLNLSQLANESWPVLTGINTAAAQLACGGSFMMYERMLGMLQQQYRSWNQDWIEATCASEASDHAALCASLHKLRGSVSTIGALHLAAVAEQAESSLREDRESPCAAVRRVGAALDELLYQVSAWQRKSQSNGE